MTTTETAHVHAWQPVGIVSEQEIARSPVSHTDDQTRTVEIAVQSCACGQLRRTLVSCGPWKFLYR